MSSWDNGGLWNRICAQGIWNVVTPRYSTVPPRRRKAASSSDKAAKGCQPSASWATPMQVGQLNAIRFLANWRMRKRLRLLLEKWWPYFIGAELGILCHLPTVPMVDLCRCADVQMCRQNVVDESNHRRRQVGDWLTGGGTCAGKPEKFRYRCSIRIKALLKFYDEWMYLVAGLEHFLFSHILGF